MAWGPQTKFKSLVCDLHLELSLDLDGRGPALGSMLSEALS